ncbi:MAG TPA: ATP-binding protein, partial [Gammaproteobacteria bacterium]|nr:ATP-binding protein [Gammaproteobacteria bacterium]
PEDRERLEQQMHDMDSHTQFRDAGDWRHLCKDGSLLDVEVHVSPAEVAGVDASLALIHDITPRKQAQLASERRARELRLLAAASLEIIASRDLHTVLRQIAERARQLVDADLIVIRDWPPVADHAPAVGISQSDAAADWRGWIERIEARAERIYAQVVEKLYPVHFNRAQLLNLTGITTPHDPDAASLPFHDMLVLPLMGADAGAAGVLLAFSARMRGFDTDEEALLLQLGHIASVGLENARLHGALQAHMQELEKRVAARTAELDTSNRELDAFAYSVAHDLRAPLRAIHGFADAVLEDYGALVDDAGRDYLKRIVKAAHSMDTLIQDLLAFSRVGRGEMDLQKVRLDEAVAEAVHDLEHEIATRQGRIEVRIPSLTVLAHPATLRQVILNLVSNALKFVAAGMAPAVRIAALARDGQVELRISDNGIGIAPEHQERIFNVFERLHGAESYPGTGIGLSIVKKGLARMRGDIQVESGADGSTFRVILREYKNE